jgi:hypothetical protein
MKCLKFALPVLGAVMLSACTTSVYTHGNENTNSQSDDSVAKSSSNYIPVATTYSITSSSYQQKSDVRSFETGVANKWQLNGGDALSSYMQSADAKSHFKSLHSGSNGALKLVMSVNKYTFAEHYATVGIQVTAYQNGKQILSRSYSGTGTSKTTQMWLAGPFGMKSAIKESTNTAMNNALNGMYSDLHRAVK